MFVFLLEVGVFCFFNERVEVCLCVFMAGGGVFFLSGMSVCMCLT